MIDGCRRTIDHLRLSLMDRCNLACRYCSPTGNASRGRTIDPKFAFEIVRWLSRRQGIRHVRLTGGEPLLYPDLFPLISQLDGLGTLSEITLTTNGQMLRRMATGLRDTGLSRVNVSLDTLDPDRFADLTRGGDIARTLDGIEAAVAAGLIPVHINVVAQRGLNEDDLPDLAEWGLSRGCVVRFLEVMPIGPMADVARDVLVPAAEVLAKLGERFQLQSLPRSPGRPAHDHAATGAGLRGVIGVIAPTTQPFCSCCRRLRVTSQGMVVPCLNDDARFDLSQCWDGETLDVERAEATLRAAVEGKPRAGAFAQSLTMLALGG